MQPRAAAQAASALVMAARLSVLLSGTAPKLWALRVGARWGLIGRSGHSDAASCAHAAAITKRSMLHRGARRRVVPAYCEACEACEQSQLSSVANVAKATPI